MRVFKLFWIRAPAQNGLSYYNTGSGQVPYTTYTNYNTGSYNPTYIIEMDSIWNTDDDELGVITIV